MMSPCGRYALIFNGEVYNHLDLRKDLGSVSWRGHSDTETILHHLMAKGIDGVADLNGILHWLFTIWMPQPYTWARDPYGVKPLYYHLNGNKMAWASEIRGLKAMIGNPEVNTNAVFQFLKLRYVPSPETMWKGVMKLEPGHWMKYDLNTAQTKSKFYSYKPNVTASVLEPDALICYDELVNRA